MKGTIYVGAETRRSLGRGTHDILVRNIVDCAGTFRVGDGVYLVVRGEDGGQSVFATAVAEWACETLGPLVLQQRLGDARVTDDRPVCLGTTVAFLWPEAPGQ